MAIPRTRALLLPILLACAASALTLASTTLLPLIPDGGTDQLYPLVSFDNNRLLWTHHSFLYNESSSAYFYILNSEGDVTRKAILKEPDHSRYFIRAFDRTNDGTIVAAGLPQNHEKSPFLAWIAPDGTTKHIVRTAPYHPCQLAVTTDGTVWTLGIESIHGRVDDPAIDLTDGILRQYDKGGKMIASALPQRDYVGKDGRELARISSGKLAASRDHLVWYSSVAGVAQLVIIPTDRIEKHVFPGVPQELLPDSGINEVQALSVLNTGEPVVSVGSVNRFATFLSDATSGRWMQLAVPALGNAAEFRAHLAGTDGNRVVFSSGTSAGFFVIPDRVN